jgi:general secretion pathway protein G
VTQSEMTWVVVPAPGTETAGIFDVRSGAQGKATDGSEFSAW